MTPALSLLDQYRTVRAFSEKIYEPLVPENYVVQSMPDVSPAKWHLAHTSWFFETFVLKAVDPDYRSPHAQYDFLFNSYYNSVGDRHCAGLLGRWLPEHPRQLQHRHELDPSRAARRRRHR